MTQTMMTMMTSNAYPKLRGREQRRKTHLLHWSHYSQGLSLRKVYLDKELVTD